MSLKQTADMSLNCVRRVHWGGEGVQSALVEGH